MAKREEVKQIQNYWMKLFPLIQIISLPRGFSLNTEVSRKRQKGFYDTIVTTRFLP